MGWIKKTGLCLGAAILIAGLGGYVWFWGRPVGITNYINKASLQMVRESPELMTQVGMIDNTPLDFHSDALDDYTRAGEERLLARLKAARDGLDRYGPEGLQGEEALSYAIAAFFFDDIIAQTASPFSNYPLTQRSGPAINVPQFLTDTHAIKDAKSAGRYVARVRDFGRVLRESDIRVQEQRAAGVLPPDFIIEKIISGLGAFADMPIAENPLVATLPARLENVDTLDTDARAQIVADTTQALREEVLPGYRRLITTYEDMRGEASSEAGVWKLPDGDKIYAAALRSNTTTDLTADEIHAIGLSEVARIEAAMNAILQDQGLSEGTVTERVQTLMVDPAHLYANTDAGRADIIAYLEDLNRRVMARAPEFFVTLPPQPLSILRIPEYSQDGAPGGYYASPSLDGTRPGRFYINLKDTADSPRWTLPTLLYHEAAPGHHFQIARAQMIEGVPILRQMSPFSAYTEGWALYSEYVAAEDMGLYDDDPLGDLGRLQAEMFRAVRLVVDTGIHHKRWTREDAIAFMRAKTGLAEAEVIREIERYIVWPGQATAYKVGQLAILDMRAYAEAQLGDAFDLRAFHEHLLSSGAMPLEILRARLEDWVEAQKPTAN